MVPQTDKKQKGVIRSLDWWTVVIYLALLTFGWVSVCGASYSYGDTDIFSLDTRSGMQIVWIGTSIVLGLVLLLLDDRSRAPDRGWCLVRSDCNQLSLRSLRRRWRWPS